MENLSYLFQMILILIYIRGRIESTLTLYFLHDTSKFY